MRYYSLDAIEKENADYNIIIGERSNGKTFALLKRIVERYVKYGEQGAYIRRYDTDLKGKRGAVLCDGIIAAGVLDSLNTSWDRIYYYSGRWYLARKEEEKIIKDDNPFMFAFSLSGMEHDKSTSYPGVRTIVYDEFLTRAGELNDEFNLFLNVISTIIRNRGDVKIFLLGNTVNRESVYFHSMGIYDIVKKMKRGDIQTVTTEKGLKISIEYAGAENKEKPSDKYYDFSASSSRMIIGGEWEIQKYPRAPRRHKKKEVYFKYYIIFNGEILECEMIQDEDSTYTLVHKKKGSIKYPERDYIFSNSYDPRRNWHRRIDYNSDKMSQIIYKDIRTGKIYFTDDETGEVLRNFLIFSQNERQKVL